MIKKFLTCAAVAAAAVALGAGNAAANDDDERHDRLVAAEQTGGSFESLRTSSGTGIYSGDLHHGSFVSVTD
jgi:hypothetical protein